MKRLTLLVSLLALSLPSFAADKWVRVQSKNYMLVGNATENEIREVAEGLEVFRSAYSRFFKLREGSSVGTTVIVFRTDQAFKPFKPLYQGKPANIAGFFQGRNDLNIIALTAEMQTPRVIYHELVHRFMSDSLGSLPPWFQEGFAECFSSLEIEGKDKKVRLGQAIGDHVELLKQRAFIPIEKLFAVAHGSPEYNEESKQGVFYAESWALVHYMMFNSLDRRNQFNQFLNEIGNGTPAPQAFQSIFNTDLASFQKTLEAYVQQRMAWNLFELTTPEGLDRSKDMKARVMSEGESELYLGDLLMRLDRAPEAEAHLKKALQLDPKLASVQAGMGRYLLDKKSGPEALAYMKRAVEIEPGNYLMHYYYATALDASKPGGEDGGRTLLRQELQKAIELAPEFVEATEMLARENLNLNVDIPQTVDMLDKAVRLAPGREYLLVELVAAMSRTQQPESARALARNLLLKPGLDPVMRKNVEGVIDYLDRRAAGARPPVPERAPVEATRRAEPPPDKPVPSEAANVGPPELRRAALDAGTPTPEAITPKTTQPSNTLQIRGMLTQLDCRNGMTLSLVRNGKTAKFHSPNPSDIKFTSFNPSVRSTITCGSTPGGGVPAEIVYIPANSGDIVGEPVSVEFMDPSISVESSVSALRAPPGTTLLKGLLTMLECSNSLTITMNSDGQILRFHNDKVASVAIFNGPNPDGTVTCGRLPGNGVPASIVFKPSSTPEALPQLLILQFE